MHEVVAERERRLEQHVWLDGLAYRDVDETIAVDIGRVRTARGDRDRDRDGERSALIGEDRGIGGVLCEPARGIEIALRTARPGEPEASRPRTPRYRTTGETAFPRLSRAPRGSVIRAAERRPGPESSSVYTTEPLVDATAGVIAVKPTATSTAT